MRETVAVVYSGAGAGGVRGGLVEMSPRHPKNYVTNAEGDDVHVDAAAGRLVIRQRGRRGVGSIDLGAVSSTDIGGKWRVRGRVHLCKPAREWGREGEREREGSACRKFHGKWH